MSEWKKVKLGELCDITSSKRCLASERSNNGIPFYCSKEIILLEKGEEIRDSDYIPVELYLSIKEKYGVPITGDLLLTTRGTNGIPYIYKKHDCFYFADGNLSWFKNFKSDLDVKYLYYWFKSDTGKHIIDSIAKGTAQKAIPIDGLRNINISIPSIRVQCKISEILSRYDALIENYQKQIKLLEESAQRLYKEWFVDLRFPGHENTKIENGVPEGWEKKQIKDICSLITSGGTPSRNNKSFWDNGNIKWVKTKELNDTWILDTEEHITETGLNSSSAKIFPPNTILMAIYASPTLGRLGILVHEACCNQAALGFIPNEFVSWQWLFYKLYELRDKFNSIARGAGQQNISAIVVKDTEIVVPEKNIIAKYTYYVTEIFNRQRTIICEIKLLTEARDRLLPKLMSGEIEI